MNNRRQETDEAIEHSLETRVSTPAIPITTRKDEMLLAIYELTDIGQLEENDTIKILEGLDLEKASETELIQEVQKRVQKILNN